MAKEAPKKAAKKAAKKATPKRDRSEPRPVLLRKPDPDNAYGWLYFTDPVGSPWSDNKKDAYVFPNDYAAARAVVQMDIRDAVLINA